MRRRDPPGAFREEAEGRELKHRLDGGISARALGNEKRVGGLSKIKTRPQGLEWV